jgi:hypothetical protein
MLVIVYTLLNEYYEMLIEALIFAEKVQGLSDIKAKKKKISGSCNFWFMLHNIGMS